MNPKMGMKNKTSTHAQMLWALLRSRKMILIASSIFTRNRAAITMDKTKLQSIFSNDSHDIIFHLTLIVYYNGKF